MWYGGSGGFAGTVPRGSVWFRVVPRGSAWFRVVPCATMPGGIQVQENEQCFYI